MGYKRRENYTPFTAGDYSDDGLIQVVSTEWAASKRSKHGNIDALRVTLREHMGGLKGHPGDMPTVRMKYMALHCVEPHETVLSCTLAGKYWEDGGWHRVLDVRIML